MRIDFLAKYKQVSEFISSPATRQNEQNEALGFSESLADFAPQFLQPVDNKTQKATEPQLPYQQSETGDDFRARLNLSQQELIAPQFDAVLEIPLNDIADGKTIQDVKTPTVVSVERTNGNGEYSRSASVAAVKDIVQQAGQHFGIDPVLGMAVVDRESSFNPKAVSVDGHQSKGLFQLLDRTGQDLLKRLGMERDYNPFDPEQNVYLGVGYLRHLHDIFSKETTLPNKTTTVVAANNSSLEKLAVAAFNAGEGRVASAQQRAFQAGKDPSQYEHIENYLPESTQQYVSRVLQAKAQFAGPLSAPIVTR
jgi:soluble lytic murein transglycosylase-like protein